MTLDITKSLDIIEIMENYISSIRPDPAIRHQVDLNYEIEDQSVILNEIRPRWNNPKEILTLGFAKATYVKSENVWKVFWKRSNNNWQSYTPQPKVKELKDFLQLVDEDQHRCFRG